MKIKITESDIRRIVKETTRRILKEGYTDLNDVDSYDDEGNYWGEERTGKKNEKKKEDNIDEGHYSGGYTDHGEPEDDQAYVDSIDYIIDSIINGNISYAKKRIENLRPKEVKELILLAREYGVEDDVLRYI